MSAKVKTNEPEDENMRLHHIAIGISMLGVTACAGTTSSGMDGTGDPPDRTAEQACVARANNLTSGKGAFAVRSDFSEANTLVIVQDQLGNQYRCLASKSGSIIDFSVM